MPTPRLGAPELTSGQAVPETTVNEQARYAEQGAGAFIVKDKDLAAPPGAPAQGDAYIVAAAPTGAWTGWAGRIAFYMGTAWLSIVPIEGTEAYAQDENAKYRYSGAAWTAISTGTGGVQSVPVLASAMTPRTTAGAGTSTSQSTTYARMLTTLDFDPATAEFAQFIFPMPKSWNEGTVTAQFLWTTTVATGDVVWGFRGIAFSDGDAFDATAWPALTFVTDSAIAAETLMQSAFTAAVTIGGAPVEGDLVIFEVYRQAANAADTLAADARLIGVRLNITTNAADDS